MSNESPLSFSQPVDPFPIDEIVNPAYNAFEIEYPDLQDIYWKDQKKVCLSKSKRNLGDDCVGNNGKAKSKYRSEMRIKDGTVTIRVKNIFVTSLPFIIDVHVKRQNKGLESALGMHKDDIVDIEHKLETREDTQRRDTNHSWIFQVNLDSVYKTADGKEIYKLCTAKVLETNMFQVVTRIYVEDNNRRTIVTVKESNPFQLKTWKSAANAKGKPGGETPAYIHQSPETISIPSPISNSSGSGSPLPPKRARSDSENEITYQQEEEQISGNFRITGLDYLHSRHAKLDNLEVLKFKTPNADIGYHLKLSSSQTKKDFKEGDVVGFFEGDDKETVIDLLKQDNYRKARLAGIITRSYYLEGACPAEGDNVPTDLVCIIGVVKVKVLGPIQNGEHLYASPTKAGVAVGQSYLKLIAPENTKDKSFLLGHALEGNQAVDGKEVSLVKAFVSVVLGIERMATAITINTFETTMVDKMKKLLRKERAHMNFKVCFMKLLLLLILTAIGIALWQRYIPNTLYRGHECRKHTMKGKIKVTFDNGWQNVTFTGLELSLKFLNKKSYAGGIPSNSYIDGDARYFLNDERCRYLGVRTGNPFFNKGKVIDGPEMVSTNCEEDHKLYYYVGGKEWKVFPKKTHAVSCLLKDV